MPVGPIAVLSFIPGIGSLCSLLLFVYSFVICLAVWLMSSNNQLTFSFVSLVYSFVSFYFIDLCSLKFKIIPNKLKNSYQ